MLHQISDLDQRFHQFGIRRLRRFIFRGKVVKTIANGITNLRNLRNLRMDSPPRPDRKAHNELLFHFEDRKAECLLRCNGAFDTDNAAQNDNPEATQLDSAQFLQWSPAAPSSPRRPQLAWVRIAKGLRCMDVLAWQTIRLPTTLPQFCPC